MDESRQIGASVINFAAFAVDWFLLRSKITKNPDGTAGVGNWGGIAPNYWVFMRAQYRRLKKRHTNDPAFFLRMDAHWRFRGYLK
jgi:hypothetical protein